jgi:adenine-specific DNA-methyltransferase
VLEAKKENDNANTIALEAEIDQLIYQLYNLTEDEIKVVEILTKPEKIGDIQ